MKNVVLASTSTLPGQAYLEYMLPVIKDLFSGIKEVVFIPYARPGGISHDDYTARVVTAFATIGLKVRGLHTFDHPADAIQHAEAFFTGGGNTFLLVQQLHALNLMDLLRTAVENGKPYFGSSAGSNIGGVNMQTTNDMPIVLPASFQTMGLVPFNLNPHYMDPVPGVVGESRETRIREFHVQQPLPVIGLREGSWIRVRGEQVILEGSEDAKIFEPGKASWEMKTGTIIDFGKN